MRKNETGRKNPVFYFCVFICKYIKSLLKYTVKFDYQRFGQIYIGD